VRLALAGIVLAFVLTPAAAAVVPFKATLKAPAANPQVDVKWWYSIKVTDLKKRPIRATLTGKVIDPFGGVHPLDYGPSELTTLKPITNRPFRGTFRDYITFPPESRGFVLTLRWTVKAKIGGKTFKRVLTRKVTPQ
jgi:hypothetical protein